VLDSFMRTRFLERPRGSVQVSARIGAIVPLDGPSLRDLQD
jgi:hypothetical protein